jgi:glycosyltransferase involved in cell wall biosynthesis
MPSLLKRCLDSIPSRPDIEIIVVDDNSNAESIKELKKISRKELQIIYTKENKGAGFARNVGVAKAHGKWILFADADDYYEPELDSFLSESPLYDADVVYFNARSEGYLHNRVAHLNYFINLSNTDLKRSEFLLKYAFGEPWCKMVKKDLIQKKSISFEEIPIHNDTQYSYLVGFFSKKIHIDRRVLYTTTNQPKSTSKQSSKKIELIRTKVFAKKNSFLKENKIDYFDDLLIEPFWQYYVQKKILLLILCAMIAVYYRISLKLIFRKILHRRHLVKSHLEIPTYPK